MSTLERINGTISRDATTSHLQLACSGQRVIIQEKSESQGHVSENVVTIQGLTSSGYLLAVTEDGQSCELHPDGNSFDFFKGLVRRKLT
ncbi:Biotin--protein ligase 2 [Orobanche gracilis]